MNTVALNVYSWFELCVLFVKGLLLKRINQSKNQRDMGEKQTMWKLGKGVKSIRVTAQAQLNTDKKSYTVG